MPAVFDTGFDSASPPREPPAPLPSRHGQSCAIRAGPGRRRCGSAAGHCPLPMRGQPGELGCSGALNLR